MYLHMKKKENNSITIVNVNPFFPRRIKNQLTLHQKLLDWGISKGNPSEKETDPTNFNTLHSKQLIYQNNEMERNETQLKVKWDRLIAFDILIYLNKRAKTFLTCYFSFFWLTSWHWRQKGPKGTWENKNQNLFHLFILFSPMLLVSGTFAPKSNFMCQLKDNPFLPSPTSISFIQTYARKV